MHSSFVGTREACVSQRPFAIDCDGTIVIEDAEKRNTLIFVIAIIGILIGMLLPAIQMVRESARRTQCLNNLKQISVALTSYEVSHRHFPPGYAFPSQTFWSAYILPQLEQKNLYDTIDLDGPWTTAGTGNHDACASYIEVFQCPSSGVESYVENGQGITNRVPCTYLACASGTINRESGPRPWVGDPDPAISNGVFFENSKVRNAQISDGKSNTILVGEALFDFELWGEDYVNSPEVVDHWYIGSDALGVNPVDESSDISEAIGSTACPINATKDAASPINDKELCFSSRHPGLAQFGFADGHARNLRETIDPIVYSALGTRNNGEVIGKWD